MVCNKKYSLVDEVCFVSDSVLVTKRENSVFVDENDNVIKDEESNEWKKKADDRKNRKDVNVNKLSIYLEKNPFGCEQNSRVFKLELDITDTANILKLPFNTEICTTKDFWRQTWNVHQR